MFVDETMTTAVEFDRAVESTPEITAYDVRWAGRTLVDLLLELRVPQQIDLVHPSRAERTR